MAESIKILYVDDNKMDRMLVRDALEREHVGFVLTEARSQDEFETLIHEEHFDLVLTDFNILGFKGLQVLEKVKSLQRDVPVIIVTGTGTEEVAVEAMKQGAGDYVIKSAAHINRLPQTIITVLEKARITREHNKAQKELARINRIYAVISQINQMIVRTTVQEKLYCESCEIAVRYGKFRLAWIGLIDASGKSVKPYCWSGHEDGYLSDNSFSCAANVPEGNGPVGTAIRSGEYAVCNNISTETMFIPWRENAIERGYQSVIALPFKMRDQVIGTFNLYADEVDFFDQNEINLLVEVINDLSFAIDSIQVEEERKQAIGKLRLSEARQRLILNSIHEVIYSTIQAKPGAFDAKADFVSDRTMDILGIQASEFIETPHLWERLIHPLDKPDLEAQTNMIFSSGKTGTRLYRMQNRKKGKYVWIEDVVVPQLNEEGKVIGTFGVARDISERKKAQEDLLKAKLKAEESDRLKSAFLTNMSHEIRTPMNGILGFASILQESGNSGDDIKRFTGLIQKSGERMLNIMNDIINISKIESGNVDVYTSKIEPDKLLMSVYESFHDEATKKGLRFVIETDAPDKDFHLISDKEKLETILTGLLKNALKFTKEGEIRVGYLKRSNHLEFFVQDTGVGIEIAKQAVIFDRFRQGSEEHTRNYEGAGLGLAIAKAFVQKLGGEIWLESQPGLGSTFYFTVYNLDLHVADKSDATDVKTNKTNQPNELLKVLIAEDEEASELYMAMMLKDMSREIIRVKTGIGAVNACRNHPDIDLILMDIQMSDMNGYEATKRIRKFNPSVTIIAQTAYALAGDKEKALAAGCNDYLAKPIKKDTFMRMIKLHLNR
ncbi:MAG: response regulator [Bacteroidales bacterium]|nr:response regulator [Bacteroidales bacterium]